MQLHLIPRQAAGLQGWVIIEATTIWWGVWFKNRPLGVVTVVENRGHRL